MLRKRSTSSSPASFVEHDVLVSGFITSFMMFSLTISFIDNKMKEYDDSYPVSDKDYALIIKTANSCHKQEDETKVSGSLTRET